MLDPNPTLNKLATMSENMGAFTAAVNMLGQLVETRTGAGEERCSTTIAQLDAEVADWKTQIDNLTREFEQKYNDSRNETAQSTQIWIGGSCQTYHQE
jgi:hypothetical protein